MDADPDPLETFEESYGTRGSRGIRGGKAARRKREAYRRYESERLGVPVEDIAVVHSGGQSRLLNTSAFWPPEDSDPSGDEAETAVEAVEAAVEDPAAEVIDLTQIGHSSQANPGVQRLIPRAKLYSATRVSPYSPLLRPRPSFSSSSRPSRVETPVPSQPVIRPVGVEVDPSVRILCRRSGEISIGWWK